MTVTVADEMEDIADEFIAALDHLVRAKEYIECLEVDDYNKKWPEGLNRCISQVRNYYYRYMHKEVELRNDKRVP